MNELEFINVSLLYRKMTGEPLSGEEQQAFDTWYAESGEHRLYYERFCRQQEKTMARECSRVDVEKCLSEVKRKGRAGRFIGWVRWSGVAAGVLILLTAGWIIRATSEKKKMFVPVIAQPMPGHAAVTLQLSHGERVVLDSTLATRTINKDHVAIRVEDGVLRYDADSVATSGSVYNELAVPASGEYMVVLGDGTKIHLNSASRLRYPTVFSEGERRVQLTGEAYFEVTQGESPFVVETSREEVKVFGTEFNVMAYEDEDISKTTLIKGSVGVRVKNTVSVEFQKIVPGEQFLLNRETGKPEIVKVDVYPYTAWREGLFVSRNDNLETILRKVARWFDVEIFYQNPGLKQKRFFGIMKRQTSLQEVLDVIAEAGDVHFNVKGRTVVVCE
ncbi:FecR family protein [Butyricimonas synergistica]|uniref:FecR family protein n=1 Tax=Butyricimonas synergistica TaxID=544644 RepID=UPI00037E29B6|nr:FecR family protein [Butyricimonas synergistica]